MTLSKQALKRLKKAIRQHADQVITDTPVVWKPSEIEDPEMLRKQALWEQDKLPMGL